MSWIIVNKSTGAAVCELYNPKTVAKINTVKYKAVPALEYLYMLNRNIKAANNE